MPVTSVTNDSQITIICLYIKIFTAEKKSKFMVYFNLTF